jgi:hypothetical protein
VFDLRYHVASLTAVFFALVIGILVGVALATHGLGNTERKRLERAVDDANARADRAQDAVTALTIAGKANSEFVKKAYTAVMADRLQGQRIAVLFVGPNDSKLLANVDQTLRDGGARLVRWGALNVPLDDAKVDGILNRSPKLASYAGPDKLGDLGREIADEFVLGGDTPVWDALQNQLVEERVGTMQPPADGVVVIRTAKPQIGGTADFLDGLLKELGDRPIPAVGVEATTSKPSAVAAYRSRDLSSVDDIDLQVGRVALALLLVDAPKGAYGTKKTAKDGVLPEVLAISTPGAGG